MDENKQYTYEEIALQKNKEAMDLRIEVSRLERENKELKAEIEQLKQPKKLEFEWVNPYEGNCGDIDLQINPLSTGYWYKASYNNQCLLYGETDLTTLDEAKKEVEQAFAQWLQDLVDGCFTSKEEVKDGK